MLQELMTRRSAYPPASSMLLRLEQVATAQTADPGPVDPDLRRLLGRLLRRDDIEPPHRRGTLPVLYRNGGNVTG